MLVASIMSREVRVVSPDASAERAWQFMQEEHIRHLVVVDDDRVIGILSDRDLGGAHGAATRAGKQARDLMTPHAIKIGADTDVREVAKILRDLTIDCLPIVDGVDGAQLVGIITTTDLLDVVAATP